MVGWGPPRRRLCHAVTACSTANDSLSEDGIRRYEPHVQEAAMQRTIAMIFALRALFAPASPAFQAPNLATPQPEIVRVANAYVKAMLASDAAVVAALYQEDAVEMPNCRPLVKGRAEIEQYFRGLMKEAKITTFVLTHTESTISGDTAYDVGTYTQRLSTRDGIVDDTGKYIVMLKRTGGEGKIAYAIHNSDRPSMMPVSGATR